MASIARPHAGIADVVHNVVHETRTSLRQQEQQDQIQHPQTPPLIPASSAARQAPPAAATATATGERRSESTSHHRKPSFSIPPPGTPAARTGPPRSVSFNYSLSPSSHHRSLSHPDGTDVLSQSDEVTEEGPDHTSDFLPPSTPFRGALDYNDPEMRERERERAERHLKRRNSYFTPDTWNPKKWLPESPRDVPSSPTEMDRAESHFGDNGPPLTEEPEGEEEGAESTDEGRADRNVKYAAQTLKQSKGSSRAGPRHTKSMPHIKTPDSPRPSTTPKWGRLRSLLPHIAERAKQAQAGPSTVVPQSVNITDELISGGLSALLLRLWIERDEKGHRRVPVLFHRLRIRVSDSLHPLHGHKAVFRIECEYANGAVRWVVYRQLREFLSLHTHYAFSSTFNQNVETLPDFPRTSLPYFKFLREKGDDVGRADFARMQRESLETYLIGLIRAVMFHPTANRLAGFLELSALMIGLAQSGSAQYKAGLLRIDAVGNKGPFGRRATRWSERKKQKWCSVRESYLIVHEEMGELAVWDVFLIDQDFKIERPTRYYRQGLNMFHQLELEFDDENSGDNGHEHEHERDEPRRSEESGRHRYVASIRSQVSKVSKVFHRKHRRSSSAATVSTNPQTDVSANGQANGHAQNGNADTHGKHGRRETHHRRSSNFSRMSEVPSSPPSSRADTPMLDPSTNTNPLMSGEEQNEQSRGINPKKRKKKSRENEVSKHTFYIENSQVRLKLSAKNERQMLQWIAALERVARESHWTGKNRFDSFAPIRLNVAAQWLVDGRDYFWNLSRAILLARDCIYIHDWWLSPELQLRRPNKEKYRLDHLLERKAKEGVKIYIILYQEVSSRTTPIDSNYAKQRLTSLHPNIMVQRSPSHFQTGTFYWAHHEKLCIIDHAIAFMGGLDHCFGRWDTPQHVLVDDPDNAEPHIWPGKDYSNPRVQDFHTLHKPEEDMYDRTKVPRMPWHDVSMQVVGQPARDLARHFVQRWNSLLRIKNHTRVMPFLLPPPEFKPNELAEMGLTGTCELQICRSAGPWSMGTPERIEHSIQNAYLKAIQMSDHFVYIENQFFITSTVVNEVRIENRIGDAIVHRIILAHRSHTPWKCCIVIPLLPGFSFPVDHSDASAIRIIMECQSRTLFRGPNSIYARLRKEGIEPDDYITVFSLRNWAKLRGDVLTTEQVYIHAKVCIVDDRLAIIGSANINERSQRGDRDSEIAAIIRDTDMIDGTMAGEPYKVGRFAHTLRVRLMREHLGVDVDSMYEDDLMASEPAKSSLYQQEWDPDQQQEYGKESGVTHMGDGHKWTAKGNLWRDAVGGFEQLAHGTGEAGAKDMSTLLRKTGVTSTGLNATAGEQYLNEERRMVTPGGDKVPGFPSAVVPTLEEKVVAERRPRPERAEGEPIEEELIQSHENGSTQQDDPPDVRDEYGQGFGAPAEAQPDLQHDDQTATARVGKLDAVDGEEEKAPGVRSTLRKHVAAKLGQKPWTLPTPTPKVDPDGFEDPICDEFWKDVWVACAVHNTEIYRKVFHAIPDDLVTTWKQYKEFVIHHERLNKPVKDSDTSTPLARVPSEAGDQDAPGQPHSAENTVHVEDGTEAKGKERVTDDNTTDTRGSSTPTPQTPPATDEKGRTKKAKGVEAFDHAEREEMERLLGEIRGHLVLYPTRFLEGEDMSNNFLFNADRLMPLPIYD
ncbi:phospholipase D [Obba rivulosa]|uniref:Phospholipase n=1 Tax=Obba rivulosa TaxID=1052685 RepID=A0A8E2DSH5_9APHY|nr:phospholipase D [Obba rivulosa]